MHVEEFRIHLEAFEEALNRELFLFYSGQKSRLSVSGLYSEYSDLFSDGTLADLQNDIDRIPNHFTSRTKGLKKLRAAGTERRLDAVAAVVSEQILEFESGGTVLWNDGKTSFARIPALLAAEPDADRRRQLNELRLRLVEEGNSLRRERISLVRDEVQSLGFKSYREAREAVAAVSYDGLGPAADLVLMVTQEDYRDRLGASIERRLGLIPNEAARCDSYYWSTPAEFDRFFPPESLMAVLSETMVDLGIHLDRQTAIAFDLENRPAKQPGALCIPIRIPGDIRVVVTARGGREDYSSLLHESGHAQHFAWTGEALAAEHRLCGDPALSEAYGFLLQSLHRNESWLASRVGLLAAGDFLAFEGLLRAYQVRRQCGRLKYELTLYGERFPPDPAAEYLETMSEVTGFNHDREDYLVDVDDALSSGDYLRGWILEAQLREYLRVRFGHGWFRTQAAGSFLKEVWETGQLYTAEELGREIGFGPLDPHALAAELREELRR